MKLGRVSVFGLGRTGLSIVKAVAREGGHVTVYDESSREGLTKLHIADEAESLGAELVFGWDKSLPPPESPGELFVVNPAVDKRSAVLAYAASLGYEIVSEIEFAFRITKAPIVAITGTNGKSTTTVMTYLCLKSCGVDAVLCGNIFGSGYKEAPLTEAALNSNANQVLVAEISSFQLEWVKEFRPIVAGITNISADHLERYDSFNDYAYAKLRIFGAQEREDFAFVGEPEYALWRSEISSKPTLATFKDDFEESQVDQLPFKEPHNLLNAQLASSLAHAALVHTGRVEPSRKPECILEGLKQFKGLAHRMERLGSKDGIEVINNSMCTNVEAVKASVRSIPGPSRILLGGKDKDLDFSPLKPLFSDGVHHAYVYGEAKTKIAEQIGAKLVYETMETALLAALDDARRGETVMLAPGCASTDQFRDFRHRGDVFKQLAKEWLES